MPRLIVPSNGGGTKLTRTLLAGEAEGVCTGAGGAVMDSSGEIEGDGDSTGSVKGVPVGDSCAAVTETQMATTNAKLTLVVMSSEVETSRIFSEDVERFLDFARNDKWPRCSSASSRLEKDYRAIRSRTGILHRGHL